MHKLLERQRQSRLKSQNPEWRAIELHIFQSGLVRRMLCGNGIHSPLGQAFN